jgi:hypothetical protein
MIRALHLGYEEGGAQMKRAWLGRIALIALLGFPMAAWGDTIQLKSGATVEGIIQKIENGRVTVQVGDETKEIDILQTTKIDFDTPHLTQGTAKLPLEHFLKDLDAQEMVRLSQDIKQTRGELRTQLDQIKRDWVARQPIDKNQTRRWEGVKETFRAPMKHYQETLQDLYLHVLAQVDAYNKFADEAQQVYIGVKGVFNIGSPLLSPELEQLQPKKFMPSTWYDTIQYEGYRRGYVEGADQQRLMQVPQAPCTSQ